jgi:hypothetical protein
MDRELGDVIEAFGLLAVPLAIILAILFLSRRRAGTLFAFGVRLSLGVLLVALDAVQIFAPDAVGYAASGQALAQYWGDGVAVPAALAEGGQGRFSILNALAYLTFAHSSLVIVALTSAAGAWTASLAARIAHHVAGEAASGRAFWLVAIFPSLVLWSALDLRDGFAILAVTGATWAGIQLKERTAVRPLATLLLWLGLLGVFREYLAPIVALGVAAGFVLGRRPGLLANPAVAVVLVASLTLVLALGGVWQLVSPEISLDRLTAIRAGLASGSGSAFLVGADTSTPGGALAYLPQGLAFFLLAPFPWAASSALQLLTVPEILVLYWLIPKMWSGGKGMLRRNPSAFWVILAVCASVSIGYALISGNVGTAYRHRAQILPLLLVLAAGGWAPIATLGERQWTSRIGSRRTDYVVVRGQSAFDV